MATVGLPKAAGSSGSFSSGGSGRFAPLRRGQSVNASQTNPFAKSRYDRMNFKSSRDPVYMAFDHLDKQPVSKLAKDFVKENIAEPFAKLFQAIAA